VYGNGREGETPSITRIKTSVFSLASHYLFQRGVLPLYAHAIIASNNKSVLFFNPNDKKTTLLEIFGTKGIKGKLFSSENTLWNRDGIFRVWNDLTFSNNSNTQHFPRLQGDLVSEVVSDSKGYDQTTMSLLANSRKELLAGFKIPYASHPSAIIFLTNNPNISTKKKLSPQEAVDHFTSSINENYFPLILKSQLADQFAHLSQENHVESFLVNVNQAESFLTH